MSQIDAEKAREIARRFLGQYHTVVDVKAVLENNVWLVTAQIGFANPHTKQVRIDSESGKILGYI